MNSKFNKFYKKFNELDNYDWKNFHQVYKDIELFLTELADEKEFLSYLLEKMIVNSKLMQFSGRNPFLKKLILHRQETSGIELRLHLFTPNIIEKPHDHRVSFSTYLLKGGYTNVLYACNKKISNQLQIGDMVPVCYTYIGEGSSYSLHHDAIHLTIIPSEAISLILRGPFVKKKWFNIDPHSGEFNYYDDKNVPAPLTSPELRETLEYLKKNLNIRVPKIDN